jgi:probable F420-dependent oxidoreductase
MPTVSVTLFGNARLFGQDLRALDDVAVRAEAAGIHQVVLPDHVLIGPHTDAYPFGSFPVPPEQPWPEPLTMLAAIASRTTTIRLSTGVLVAPLRSAALLAKTVATLDAISGGRVDLGVGTGWQREEYEATGVPFAGRGARMDDQLHACHALWDDAPATFAAPTVAFRDMWCLPRPVQPGGVPIWFGGPGNAKTGRRIAALGAGWLPIAGTRPDAVRDGLVAIRAAVAAAGRDPASVGVRVTATTAAGPAGPDLARTIAAAGAHVAAGATAVAFPLAAFVPSAGDVDDVLAQVAAAARDWGPGPPAPPGKTNGC